MVRAVVRRLPPRATTVVYPDHPYLLQPPEILVGHRGAMTAIFLLGDGERLGTGRHVLARYLLCRFALPAHAVFLVIATRPDLAEAAADAEVADKVVSARARPLTGSEERLDSRWNVVIDELRGVHLARFAEAWATPVRLRDEMVQRDRPGWSTLAMNIDDHHWPRSRHLDVSAGRLVLGRLEDRSAAQQWAAVSSASLAAARLDYGLELGVNGLHRTAGLLRGRDAHLANHVGLVPLRPPGRAFDPEKFMRAAAFAGFSPALRPETAFDNAL